MSRILSLLTLFLFITSSATLRAQKGDWYTDDSSLGFAGHGTKASPYLIASVSDLVALADQANAYKSKGFPGVYFRLTADLDLGAHYWIPIGTEAEYPFRGIFDGNGKCIRNLYLGVHGSDNLFPASGLFGCLGNGARVENLSIEGGRIWGGNREQTARSGALAGYAYCTEDSIIIRNCHNDRVAVYANGTETTQTGGLIGECCAASSDGGEAVIRLEDCSNSGTVHADTAFTAHTGGLVGKAGCRSYADTGGKSAGRLLLLHCKNSGTVRGGSVTGGEALSATGGLVGYVYANGNTYGKEESRSEAGIAYCLNTGDIRGGTAFCPQSLTYTGGLVGYVDGSSYAEGQTRSPFHGLGRLNLSTSANRGAVQGGRVRLRSGSASTGGLIGYASAIGTTGEAASGAIATGDFLLRNCYNAAALFSRRGMLGGLIGTLSARVKGKQAFAYARVSHCYAAGTLNQGDTIFPVITGGLFGHIQKDPGRQARLQAIGCLAALTYLNGLLEHTFRLAGQMEGFQNGENPLAGNYAYAAEGEWVRSETKPENGLNWRLSLAAPPLASWNLKEKTWLFPSAKNSLPLLLRLEGQEAVPLPAAH
ncbi:MAG: hypothetical protein LBL81_00490 [Tannerella sp.]|jgi:hypothetical protein|nr:hypothetical protein [Tannerella sp.]